MSDVPKKIFSKVRKKIILKQLLDFEVFCLGLVGLMSALSTFVEKTYNFFGTVRFPLIKLFSEKITISNVLILTVRNKSFLYPETSPLKMFTVTVYENYCGATVLLLCYA